MLISWVARGTGLAAGAGMPVLLPWQPLAWGTSLMTDRKMQIRSGQVEAHTRRVCVFFHAFLCFAHASVHVLMYTCRFVCEMQNPDKHEAAFIFLVLEFLTANDFIHIIVDMCIRVTRTKINLGAEILFSALFRAYVIDRSVPRLFSE